MRLLKVAAAALNQTPLDWDGNRDNILGAIAEARDDGVGVLCLPELCITGYGCEDAFLSPARGRHRLGGAARDRAADRAASSSPSACRCSSATPSSTAPRLLADGKILGFVAKQYLAGDGLHYEPRWFKPWPRGVLRRARARRAALAARRPRLRRRRRRHRLRDLRGRLGGARGPARSWRARASTCILNPWPATSPSASTRCASASCSRARAPSASATSTPTCSATRPAAPSTTAAALIATGRQPGRQRPALHLRRPPAHHRRRRPRPHAHEPGAAVRASRPSSRSAPASACARRSASRRREAASRRSRAAQLAAWEHSDAAQGRGVRARHGARPLRLPAQERARAASSCRSAAAPTRRRSAAWWRSMVELAWSRARPRAASSSRLGLACARRRDAARGGRASCSPASTRRRATAREATPRGGARGGRGARRALLRARRRRAGRRLHARSSSEALGRDLDWERDDLALQNIQARARAPGVWLLANLQQALLLATSNRSEAAVGYATMDGDTAGGLAPIAGIDKAFLRHWLRWLETDGPDRVCTRSRRSPPSTSRPRRAELRPPGAAADRRGRPHALRAARRHRASSPSATSSRRSRSSGCSRPRFEQHPPAQMAAWVERFFRLLCRNQWKRERYAPSFHVDDENLDPKTWCRFPILSGGFERELEGAAPRGGRRGGAARCARICALVTGSIGNANEKGESHEFSGEDDCLRDRSRDHLQPRGGSAAGHADELGDVHSGSRPRPEPAQRHRGHALA